MIIYEASNIEFQNDILNGSISKRVEDLFLELGIRKESQKEYMSWKNSLPRMGNILSNDCIDDNVRVAIEFQIPLTSRRVDFMIAGNDGKNDNIIVIELKQWDKCEITDKENIVNALTGGNFRDVPHPSQQAYSYAKLIENFNESVHENDINMIPCAYLHNYENKYRNEIFNDCYKDIIELAPVFIQEDGMKLREFIQKYIKKPSSKNLFQLIDNGKLKPSKALQDVVGSILNNNKEFELIDEQIVSYATVMSLIDKLNKDDSKKTIIIEGGPGTGKSVIAINLLANILKKGYSCSYVTKNSAPRYNFSKSLVAGKHKLSYLKGLFKGSGSFIDCPSNTFDCLLADEAHRLNAKSGMFSNLGENQIKEIINASKISVFFIDENQVVSSKDIGTINEIENWAKKLNSQVYRDESLILTSQFRCNGSDGYLAFLDDLLGIRQTANYNYIDIDYDIKIFDDPNEMREVLRQKNTNNKSRMIAGYCYPWLSKKDKKMYDIILKNDFKAQWNFDTENFAINPNAFEQVGCIHSTQGLEFDYVGIIIGKDLCYKNNKVITDKTQRDKNDATIKGLKDKPEVADIIIRNTYRTLMSRGQKGCYIYCEDEQLSNYIKKRLDITKKYSKEMEKYNG